MDVPMAIEKKFDVSDIVFPQPVTIENSGRASVAIFSDRPGSGFTTIKPGQTKPLQRERRNQAARSPLAIIPGSPRGGSGGTLRGLP
jgi:hypothetical protein